MRAERKLVQKEIEISHGTTHNKFIGLIDVKICNIRINRGF